MSSRTSLDSRPLAVYVVSLGCAKNLVDTEVMCGGLVTEGFCLAADLEDADVMLVNTCGFIHDARREAEDAIAEAMAWKGRSRRKFVVVSGCLAQRDPAALRRRFPGIDLLLGLDDVPRLPMLLKQRMAADAPLSSPEHFSLPTYLYDHASPRLMLTLPTYGYVKVAEGCDHRCAYCAIPLIRGKQRSRLPSSVLTECRQLLDSGVREINLIAQDTSRYGTDLEGGENNLESLLRQCDELEGDFWVRVLYTHPLYMTDGLLDIMANGRHVVPYLDIPLQHISTPVLQRMGRGMDGERTRALLEKIRRLYPQMTIRTTFLVGFPGETEEDYRQLLEFVQEFGFDRMGAFAFSPEEGTPAEKMPDAVPVRVAVRRRSQLLAAQQKVSLERNRRFAGKTVRVLLEERIGNRRWTGRTAGDAAEVDQTVEVQVQKGRTEAGFANVRILHTGDYSLTGEEVSDA